MVSALAEKLKPKFLAVFKKFDVDKNDYIDLSELRALAKATSKITFGEDCDGKALDAAVARMLEDFDLNGDNKVTWDEFWKFWSDTLKEQSNVDGVEEGINAMLDGYLQYEHTED